MTKWNDLPLTFFEPKKLLTRDETLGRVVKPLREVSREVLSKKVVLLGVPDERGITANQGNPGASEGPAIFRKALYGLYDAKNRSGTVGELLIDGGDVHIGNDVSEAHENLAVSVQKILEAGARSVVVVGGGHDFSYGSYKGHHAAKGFTMPIVNFDAHLDLRPIEGGKINSGTPFRRIIEDLWGGEMAGSGLLEVGIQLDRNPLSLFAYALEKKVSIVEYRAGQWLNQGIKTSPQKAVKDHIEKCRLIDQTLTSTHLSLDLDVFASWIAPGTSASTPFGCGLDDVLETIVETWIQGNVGVFDFAELSPIRDFNQQTSRLAAGILFRCLSLI